MAGYQWCCGVNKVSATWTAPVIASATDDDGIAYLWCGLQSDNSFVQIGTGTLREYSGNVDEAFWSSNRVEFRAQWIGRTVMPGDRVSATVSAHGALWVATFRDVTAGWSYSKQYVVHRHSDSPFAECLLEGYPPIPRTRKVIDFSNLVVDEFGTRNVAAVAFGRVGHWFAVDDESYVPTPIQGDAFAVDLYRGT